MTRLVFVPSPFVGPGSCRPLAAAVDKAVVADYGALVGPDWYGGVAERVAVCAGNGPWIAVLHSGAGGFAPALAAAASDLAGFIFMDAILPYPGRSWMETAPPALADRLGQFVVAGRSPPWNEWFGYDPTPMLLPDRQMREAFISELPCVAWSFLEAVSPDDRRWEQLPSAYVQLSRGYEEEADRAARREWAVRRADLHHLAMMTAPADVAALLAGLPLATCST